MEKGLGRSRPWQDLEKHYSGLIDEFTSDFRGERRFLRHLWETESQRWSDPQALYKTASRAAVRRLEYQIRSKPGRSADAQRRILRVWYGRHLDKPFRWFWFSALVPYLTFKNGRPNWQWLSEWVEATEETAIGSDALRKWWAKNLKSVSQASQNVPTAAEWAARSRSDAQPRREIIRESATRRLLDGMWAYVRFLREGKRSMGAGDLTDLFVMPYVAKNSLEREYVSRGVLKTFKFLKAKPLSQRSLQDYYDALAGPDLNPIPKGYLEVVPRV